MEVTSHRRRRHNRSMQTTTVESDNMADPDDIVPERRSSSQQCRSNSRPKKPLNFNKAMSDFQTMFPHIERDVIEAVLRANDGVVQTTIDQLLILAESSGGEELIKDGPQLPNYHECQRSPFVIEPPPAYTEFAEDQLIDFDRPAVAANTATTTTAVTFNNDSATPSLSFQPQSDSPRIQNDRLRYWNPPIVGSLPEDFLRVSANSDAPIVNRALNTSNRNPSIDEFLTDSELEQFLEDQKLALYLQNKEFIRQLRHDPDFVTSLEEDHREFMQSQMNINDASRMNGDMASSPDTSWAMATSSHATTNAIRGGAKPKLSSSTTNNQDDAVFHNKLRHMGRSTRKKFGRMAKKFRWKKPQRLGFEHGMSTANLLEEEYSEEEENKKTRTGLEGIEEYQFKNSTLYNEDREDEVPESKEKRGRKLPTLPDSKTAGNEEPIVFYSEDNEFDFKED